MRKAFLFGFLLISHLLNGQEMNNLRLGHFFDNKLEIIELNNRNEVTIIYSNKLSDSIPVSAKGDKVLFDTPKLSIYSLSEKTFTDINENASEYYIGGFYTNKDWFYYSRLQTKDSDLEIVIYNYKTKRIEKVINGFLPNLSKINDCLYFMRAEIDSSKSETIYKRFIYKLQPNLAKEELVTTINLGENGADKYDLTEVVEFDCSKYFYRVYDEHEYRYYSDWDGTEKDFFSGGHGHFKDGINKEQFNLCFSSDGKYAAFTERNWNELTYIVLIDLVDKKRYEFDIYGSFPVFFNQSLYFVSDPKIVKTNDVEFRQIKDYALYSLDLLSKKLRLVHDFEGEIQWIK